MKFKVGDKVIWKSHLGTAQTGEVISVTKRTYRVRCKQGFIISIYPKYILGERLHE